MARLTEIAQLPEILTNCRFFLSLDGHSEVDGIFLECKGFKTTQDVVEICSVTPRGQIIRTKIPGNTKVGNLILRRGMHCSMALWDWFKAIQDGGWATKRKNGSLTIYDQSGSARAIFEFSRAWPTRYTATDVSARTGEFEIEELELAVEGFARIKT